MQMNTEIHRLNKLDLKKLKRQSDLINNFLDKSEDSEEKLDKLLEVMANCPDCTFETIANSLCWPIDFR